MKRIFLTVLGLVLYSFFQFCFAESDIESRFFEDFDSTPIDFVNEKPLQNNVYKLRAEYNNHYSYEDYKRETTLDYGKDRADSMLTRQFESRQDIDSDITTSKYKLYKGSVSFGGKHRSKFLDPNGSRSTSVFSEYNYKKFTLNTEYTRSANERSDIYTDKIKFTNEYNLYDDLALQYIINQNVNSDIVQRGVGIKYTPKIFDDTLEFSADVRNKYTPSADPSHQFNFETKFRF